MWSTALVGLVVLAGAVVMLFAARRLRQLRAGGIDVALRVHQDGRARGWHLGIARYHGEEFVWYRALGLGSGPNWVLDRSNVEIVGRRSPSNAETYTMPARSMVLHLSCRGGDIEVAMGPDALTGFLSWLESAPPGTSVPWAS